MVELKNNEVIVTLQADDPAGFLTNIQNGLVEIVKSLLLAGSEGSDLELDRPTANGIVCALDLLQATLIEPEILESTMCFAEQVTCIKNQVSRIRGSLAEIMPGGTTWICETERWPVGEN